MESDSSNSKKQRPCYVNGFPLGVAVIIRADSVCVTVITAA
jgi:hypothetical protein